MLKLLALAVLALLFGPSLMIAFLFVLALVFKRPNR